MNKLPPEHLHQQLKTLNGGTLNTIDLIDCVMKEMRNDHNNVLLGIDKISI